MTPVEYRRAVRAVVAAIPAGRVMAYGAIATYLAEVSGRASPRLVGQVMARHGDRLPWHRVVQQSGHPARGHEARALRRLRDEGAPLSHRGLRVDMANAAWAPDEPATVLLARIPRDARSDRSSAAVAVTGASRPARGGAWRRRLPPALGVRG